MHHPDAPAVLVYGDSLSWGIIPGTRERLPYAERWPGVLDAELRASGRSVRLIEDCLNGRRTVFEDPFKPGRSGLAGLEQRLETVSPLALLILLLGVNDFQAVHHHYQAAQSAQGTATLIAAIRRAPIEPGMTPPRILVVSPPAIRPATSPIGLKFAGAEVRSAGLAEAQRAVARELGCEHFDAGSVARACDLDGVHLDADQHLLLGKALAPVAGRLLS